MSKIKNTTTKSTLRSSYITTIVSVSLVLFLLGIVGLLLLLKEQVSSHVKENIGFTVILKNDVKDVDIEQIKKSLDIEAFVKSTQYVGKDSAAAQLQRDLGEDFLSFLGENPLRPSIDVKLNAAYANTDSLANIKAQLIENTKIKEVFYQPDLVSAVNQNINKINFYLLLFSSALLLIAIVLINNTIRLSIYSKRFLIKTMQLVGAKNAFIKKPFILNSIGNGIVSAFIAIGLLVALLHYLQQEIPDIVNIANIALFGALFLAVIIVGIIISWFSTNIAINKYLNIKTGDLF